MEIKALIAIDTDELAEVEVLFEEMYRHLSANGVAHGLRERGARLWRESLQNLLGRTQFLAVARLDGKIAGFVQAQLKILPGYFDAQKSGFIPHLFVRSEYRRSGVGGHLVESALAWLRSLGFEQVELDVLQADETAVKFWTKQGFAPETIKLRRIV